MLPAKAPSNLPELVKAAFSRARAGGDLTYFPTQVAILNINSIPFQLRFSPALANKPIPSRNESKKPHDPFDNPSPQLLVAELPPSHILVLNKFAVVPEHFILATKAFKQQTHVLEAEDLAATYACIESYAQIGGEGLFAFFNSGEHSGASQPHRHVQLLPIRQMKEGLAENDTWSVLASSLGEGDVDRVPFATFSERIRPEMAPEELRAVYLRLYRKACRAVASFSKTGAQDISEAVDGEAQISYNLAMTQTTLTVMPRLAEGASIITHDGSSAGTLSLNGTVLAGTALVRNDAEWVALRGEPKMMLKALRKIGVPPLPPPDK